MKNRKSNTGYSQVVTHPGTNPTRRHLTSAIRQELVVSAWYGRRQQVLSLTYVPYTFD